MDTVSSPLLDASESDEMDTYESDEYENDDDWDDNYYVMDETGPVLESSVQGGALCKDPEFFEYECLSVKEVNQLWNETVEYICQTLQLSPSKAKELLYRFKWDLEKIREKKSINSASEDETTSLTDYDFYSNDAHEELEITQDPKDCPICFCTQSSDCIGLACGHLFCADCWTCHIETQVSAGSTLGIECMAQRCSELVPEEFALEHIQQAELKQRYKKNAVVEFITAHPELRFCPGLNCKVVIRSKENKPKRVICDGCGTSFCYKCSGDYHAPADCDIIRKWLEKCEDDSDSANYISAHTRVCPKCHVSIEKNGGCNHMRCTKCKYKFCWICLGDLEVHGRDYECKLYKEATDENGQSVHSAAIEALGKYPYYFEQWVHHTVSLRIEAEALTQIKDTINQKVMSGEGTWIDWQYLLDAAALLAKSRYTLKYTYPCAYYMNSGPKRNLFEYQQGQLKVEIEKLSLQLHGERDSRSINRRDLENQMDITEKRRAILLKDFYAD